MTLLALLNNPAISNKLGQSSVSNSTNSFQLLARTAINTAFGLAGLILFFMLIRGGYTYLTAGGDKEAVQKAVKQITTALVGAAIIFSVYAILFIVETLFGIPLLSFNLPVIN